MFWVWLEYASLRGNDDSKHAMTVAVKWFIRSIGIVAIYNASASPMGSLFFLSVLAILYLVYAANKWVFSRFAGKKSSTGASEYKRKTQ